MEFVKRFTTFDKLIATSLIKVLYWIGIVFIAIGSLGFLLGAFSSGFVAGVGGLLLTPVVFGVSVVFWRFICEIYIVLFGIYNKVTEMRDFLAATPDALQRVAPATPTDDAPQSPSSS